MDVVQSYFHFTVVTRCGIPRITLLGTPEDWQSLRQRAANFAKFGLEWWTEHLLPLLDEFVTAAEGQPNVERWRSFYKYESISGGPFVQGWINTLFPYLKGSKRGSDEPWQRNDFVRPLADGEEDPRWGGGPTLSDFPIGMRTIPFNWEFLGETIAMKLLSGFSGITQDPTTLSLRPQLGWAIAEA